MIRNAALYSGQYASLSSLSARAARVMLDIRRVRDADLPATTALLRNLVADSPYSLLALTALTATAREGRTQPAEMAGGTFTITNVGVFGIDSGTPIINPGESAILAFGAIRKEPWVVSGPGGDEIAVRHVTTLALSFDHRHIDGQKGSQFLSDVAAILEDPVVALLV